jgi:hypothetical protein
MTSPFSLVSPEQRSPIGFQVGEQCMPVRLPNNGNANANTNGATDGKERQMYVFFDSSNALNYSQWRQLDTIHDIPRENGMYNFIVYKRKNETYDIIFAQQKLPNEMASKHFYLSSYIEKEGLTLDNKVYLAGELFRSGSNENPYYSVNLQSGTFTKGYKEKWLERPDTMASIGARDEYELERILFERIKPLLQKRLKREAKDIQYIPETLLTNYVVEFHPDVYLKLRELGIKSYFFENSIGCQLYKIQLMLDAGNVISSLATRKVRPYIERIKGKVTIKPEFKELIRPISLDDILSEYSAKGGRRTRNRNQKKTRGKRKARRVRKARRTRRR